MVANLLGAAPAWVLASLAFFAYLAIMAACLRRLPGAARSLSLVHAGLGALISTVPLFLPLGPLLMNWVLPPVLLLHAYWGTGHLFVGPMPRLERALAEFDLRLRVGPLAARTPRWLAELLELAYSGVYPLIPIALAVHLLLTDAPDAARFWSVILVTDYICFGALAWIQTRPPRAFDESSPWRSAYRVVNLRLLGAASVRVNTFPSGHAAEGLAAALLVLGAPWPVVAWLFVSGLAVSAGAVFGRYHYALDALAGWFVAVAVWFVFR